MLIIPYENKRSTKFENVRKQPSIKSVYNVQCTWYTMYMVSLNNRRRSVECLKEFISSIYNDIWEPCQFGLNSAGDDTNWNLIRPCFE